MRALRLLEAVGYPCDHAVPLTFFLLLFSDLEPVCFLVCAVGEHTCAPLFLASFHQTGKEGASFVLTGTFLFTHVPPRNESCGFLRP